MRAAQALSVLAAERRQSSADPTGSGGRHGGEQAPVARVCQAEHVVRDLGGPVAGEHAQGDVLVNDAHGRSDRSAGEFRVVLGLRR